MGKTNSVQSPSSVISVIDFFSMDNLNKNNMPCFELVLMMMMAFRPERVNLVGRYQYRGLAMWILIVVVAVVVVLVVVTITVSLGNVIFSNLVSRN